MAIDRVFKRWYISVGKWNFWIFTPAGGKTINNPQSGGYRGEL
jgi:hypothetical protein